MKKAKKILLLLLAVCLTAALTPMTALAEPEQDYGYLMDRHYEQPELPDIPGLVIKPDDPLPKLTARSAILIEATTGKIIYGRDIDTRRYPASTTKMMTLIIALEKGNLNDTVTIGHRAEGVEGSTLWLQKGERIRLHDLLCGMMMVSGNDATVAIAEHISGSVPAFARLMTDKAHELGAANTNFVNASGLPDERHYTTAHDLAKIAAYGYKNPEFAAITSTREIMFPWVHDDSHRLRNENQLLWLYRGANGVKTGYTDAAGRCLVAGAKRNGIQLIAVVLDSYYMWNDSIALLDYGFKQIKTRQLFAAGDRICTVPVAYGQQKEVAALTAEPVIVPITDAEGNDLAEEIDIPATVKATVKKGDVLGKLRIKCAGQELATVDLLAANDVERKSFFLTLYHKCRSLFP